MEAGLASQNPFARGTSALALSRLLGNEAYNILDGRDREASDDLERTLVLSAQIISGDLSRGLDLDAALQRIDVLPLLRRCWKREILSALALAQDCQRRAELWAEIAGDELPRLQSELASTLPLPSNPDEAPAALPQSSPSRRIYRPGKVFVSYSHRDVAWLKRFQTALAPLIRKEIVDLWVDTKLQPGQKWYSEIEKAMDEATIALFLVSPQFLAS
jgi:hypothetical protein